MTRGKDVRLPSRTGVTPPQGLFFRRNRDLLGHQGYVNDATTSERSQFTTGTSSPNQPIATILWLPRQHRRFSEQVSASSRAYSGESSVLVTPVHAAVRDSWVCRICGIATPQTQIRPVRMKVQRVAIPQATLREKVRH